MLLSWLHSSSFLFFLKCFFSKSFHTYPSRLSSLLIYPFCVSVYQSNKNIVIDSYILLTTSVLSLNPFVFCLLPSELSFFSIPPKPCCSFCSVNLCVMLQISPNYFMLQSCFSSISLRFGLHQSCLS